jgi:hypothetical protein
VRESGGNNANAGELQSACCKIQRKCFPVARAIIAESAARAMAANVEYNNIMLLPMSECMHPALCLQQTYNEDKSNQQQRSLYYNYCFCTTANSRRKTTFHWAHF